MGGKRAGEMGRTAGAGDQYLDAAALRSRRVFGHRVGAAMRGQNLHFVGDVEFTQHTDTRGHDVVIRNAPHQHTNAWRSHVYSFVRRPISRR